MSGIILPLLDTDLREPRAKRQQVRNAEAEKEPIILTHVIRAESAEIVEALELARKLRR